MAGFSLRPHYTISSGFLLLSCQLTAALDGSVPVGFQPILSKTTKRQGKCTAVPGLAFFFLSLILPGRRRHQNLQTHYALRAPPAGASRYALHCDSTAGQARCMPCKMSCIAPHQLAFSSAVSGFVRGRPLATWSPLAITLGCPVVLCSSSDSTKLLLAPQPCIASLRPIQPSCLSSGACFFAH